MNVLTLTSQDQVDKYSSNNYKLLKEGNYDKVVFNGITNLIGDYVGGNHYDNEGFIFYVPEIEVQNCTIIKTIDILNTINPVKITIKDSTILEGLSIYGTTTISAVIDNLTNSNSYTRIEINNKKKPYTGNKSRLLFKNSSKLKINSLDIDTDICDVEFSNNHDAKLYNTPIGVIPDNKAEQTKFLSQFTTLVVNIKLTKIDESNYQFEQADWDKLIPLLDAYPKLFKQIKYDGFGRIVEKTNYIHIPSLTFPLCWLTCLIYIADYWYDSAIKDFHCIFYINKNNWHNFTLTHIDLNSIIPNNGLLGFLIADNYKDIMQFKYTWHGMINTYSKSLYYYYNALSFFSILSGKMVTSEITLMPNTHFRIRTLGSDMKIKTIKEVTGFHTKTIKVTGMEPFMLLSVAATTCFDIDGKIKIPQNASSYEGGVR